jgi:hypothetical protein
VSIKGTVSKRAEPKKNGNQTKTDHEEQKADQGHAKPFGGSIGESIVEQPSGSNPKRGYFSKGKNWVSLLTLLFVGAYTVITIFILCNSQ